jgi:mono/diheme cytochrome c family protein
MGKPTVKKKMRFLVLTLLATGVLWAQVVVPGDARQGTELFRTLFCVTCHSVNGEGGESASDLGKDAAHSSTPFFIANLMWNHAPTMWAAMEKNGIQKPKLSQEEAADLFAFFWTSRYFDRPGNEARGREKFAAKHCAECHSISAANPSGGPPVATWQSLSNPTAISAQMWNHSAKMRSAVARKKVPWPELTAQDLDDLVAYLQSLPEAKTLAREPESSSKDTGEALFQAKGCANCHKETGFLPNRSGYRSMSDFAASMWNHGPQLSQQPASLTATEMHHIVGYLWSIRYFEASGDVKQGRKVFETKKCGLCHNDPSSGAPRLVREGRSAFAMVAVLWQHGPTMLARMKERQIPWPRFHGSELADLAAYLGELR